MKVTKTVTDLKEMINNVGKILQMPDTAETKLYKIASKQLRVLHKSLEETDSRMEDMRLNHASVDDRGNILYEEGGYAYKMTKDNKASFAKAVAELYKEKITLEFFIKPEDIEGLPPQFKAYLEMFMEPEPEEDPEENLA
jgi:hypothetical protein